MPELHTLFKIYFFLVATKVVEVTMGHEPNEKGAFGVHVLEPQCRGTGFVWLINY